MNHQATQPTSGRWLPAESVVVLPCDTVNARGHERSGRYAGNGPWQQYSCLARAHNGDVLCMTTLADPQHSVLLRSCDQGRTWSQPQYIWENTADDEYAASLSSLTVLRSGRIFGLINGEYPGWACTGKNFDYRRPTWAMSSDDQGATWTLGPPVTATSPFLSVVTHAPRELSDGSLILPVWGPVSEHEYWNFATWASGVLRSYDGGVTWGDGTIVMHGDSRFGTFPNEIAILPLANGVWLAMFRMNWVTPSAWPSVMLCRSFSGDQGRTWSPPEQVLGQTGYVCLQQLPDGAVMVSGSGAFGVRYLISHDDGGTWAYEQLLESCGDSNTTSVVLDDETVFLVHGAGLGAPHYVQHLHPHAGYWYAGLRGRWIRKQ